MTDFALGHSSARRDLGAARGGARGRLLMWCLREAGDVQVIVALGDGRRPLTIGRGEGTDIQLHWDRDVSRTHAELERVGGVVDDLRRRALAQRHLRQRRARRQPAAAARRRRPALRRHPRSSSATRRAARRRRTAWGADVAPPTLSEAQRKVLVALCRPYKDPGPFATPATNQEIADELCLSVDAVKTHLRALFSEIRRRGPSAEPEARASSSSGRCCPASSPSGTCDDVRACGPRLPVRNPPGPPCVAGVIAVRGATPGRPMIRARSASPMSIPSHGEVSVVP